jgi:hypothetical protein
MRRGLVRRDNDMSVKMKASISVAIAGLLCFSTYVSAQPNKELYELQERCGKRAAEVFKREYRPGSNIKGEQIRFNYENHYSARLNKCFFLLEIAVSYEKEKSSKIMRLLDLNDNKEYGIYMSGFCDGCVPVSCFVQDNTCRSERERRQLVKPFMED